MLSPEAGSLHHNLHAPLQCDGMLVSSNMIDIAVISFIINYHLLSFIIYHLLSFIIYFVLNMIDIDSIEVAD